jgi:Ca2+-binding RTX toxin-like protein
LTTLYLQYQYTKFEAKPRDYDPLERITIPGTSASIFKYGTVFDYTETAAPWYPGWEFDPNTRYDYFSRGIGVITSVKPPGGSGSAAEFSGYQSPPNKWFLFTVDAQELAALKHFLPPSQDQIAPEFFAFSDARATFTWSDVSTSVNLTASWSDSFEYVVAHYASANSGLVSFVDTALRVQSVSRTLQDFMNASVGLFADGITNFETMDAAGFSARVNATIETSYAAFLGEVEKQLGTTNAASTFFKSVNFVGAYAAGDADFDVSVSTSVTLPGTGGIAMVGAYTRFVQGSDLRDVVIANGGDTTGPGTPVSKSFLLMGGDDVFVGSGGTAGVEQVFAGDGDDTIYTYGSVDLILGERGNDYIESGAGNDIVRGGRGADNILAGAGRDNVSGGRGSDTAILGAGNDTYFETDKPGKSGSDRVFGALGNDKIRTGSSADVIKGGPGRDIINGGSGNDQLTGGPGADTFVFGKNFGKDKIFDFGTGGDILKFDDAIWSADHGTLNQVQLISQFATVSDGNVVFDFGGGDRLTLIGVASTIGLSDDIIII